MNGKQQTQRQSQKKWQIGHHHSKITSVFKEVTFVIFYDFMDYSVLKYFKDYTKYMLQKFLK
jgi:hypothetical protein